MSEREAVVVSACLLGVNCRYDGTSRRDEYVLAWLRNKTTIPVCPEAFSGLGFPRLAAEIEKGDGFTVLSGKARVLLKDGTDVTRAFMAGARECLKLARISNARVAVLKDRSPSCGVNHIYIRGKKSRGAGILAALLLREGFTVLSEKELTEKSTD